MRSDPEDLASDVNDGRLLWARLANGTSAHCFCKVHVDRSRLICKGSGIPRRCTRKQCVLTLIDHVEVVVQRETEHLSMYPVDHGQLATDLRSGHISVSKVRERDNVKQILTPNHRIENRHMNS